MRDQVCLVAHLVSPRRSGSGRQTVDGPSGPQVFASEGTEVDSPGRTRILLCPVVDGYDGRDHRRIVNV